MNALATLLLRVGAVILEPTAGRGLSERVEYPAGSVSKEHEFTATLHPIIADKSLFKQKAKKRRGTKGKEEEA